MTNSSNFTVAATKNVQSNRIYVSVVIVGLLIIFIHQHNVVENKTKIYKTVTCSSKKVH